MKLFNIDNAERFFERVLRCQGNVYCVEADGQLTDMKRLAEYFTRSGMAGHMKGIDEISMVLEREDDVVSLMNYAAQMAMEDARRPLSA